MLNRIDKVIRKIYGNDNFHGYVREIKDSVLYLNGSIKMCYNLAYQKHHRYSFHFFINIMDCKFNKKQKMK